MTKVAEGWWEVVKSWQKLGQGGVIIYEIKINLHISRLSLEKSFV